MQTAMKTNQAVALTQGGNADAEPYKFRKRIGSTVYVTNVYFKNDATESMDDIILRLIRREARSGKAAG
jgi:hypothetical protein